MLAIGTSLPNMMLLLLTTLQIHSSSHSTWHFLNIRHFQISLFRKEFHEVNTAALHFGV
jgi:hypothetical protein